MNCLRIVVLAFAVLASFQATARQSVPIASYENVVAADTSGKARTEEQVKQAIATAAAVKQWSLKEVSPGVMLATLHVRGKHTVVTEIRYSADKYVLTFKESINMNQTTDKEGRPIIHPFYNVWAKELADEIRVALARA